MRGVAQWWLVRPPEQEDPTLFLKVLGADQSTLRRLSSLLEPDQWMGVRIGAQTVYVRPGNREDRNWTMADKTMFMAQAGAALEQCGVSVSPLLHSAPRVAR